LCSKALGLCVISFALYVLRTTRNADAEPRAPFRKLLAVVLNWFGGLVGALFGGTSTPFYPVYLSRLRLSRDAFRATMTMIVLVQVVVRIGGYAGIGVFSRLSVLLVLGALPFMALGAVLGERLAKRVPPVTFTRIVSTTLLLSGAVLAMK